MHPPVISPAVRTGILEVFSIGALLTGFCLLAVSHPARLQRLSRLGQRLARRFPLPLGRPAGRHAATSR
jgi:hypothetical protein